MTSTYPKGNTELLAKIDNLSLYVGELDIAIKTTKEVIKKSYLMATKIQVEGLIETLKEELN